jgi:hypothetical protein
MRHFKLDSGLSIDVGAVLSPIRVLLLFVDATSRQFHWLVFFCQQLVLGLSSGSEAELLDKPS